MRSVFKSILVLFLIVLAAATAVYVSSKIAKKREVSKLSSIEVKTNDDYLLKNYGFSFDMSTLSGLSCYKDRPLGPDRTHSEINSYFVCETARQNPYAAVGWFDTEASYKDIQQNMANSLLLFSGWEAGNYSCVEDTAWIRNNSIAHMRQQMADCEIARKGSDEKILFSVYYVFPLVNKRVGNYLLVSDLGKGNSYVPQILRTAAKTLVNKVSTADKEKASTFIEEAYAYGGGDSCTAAAAAASSGTGCGPGAAGSAGDGGWDPVVTASCTNGATNYPSCDNICTNGYMNYPTCGPVVQCYPKSENYSYTEADGCTVTTVSGSGYTCTDGTSGWDSITSSSDSSACVSCTTTEYPSTWTDNCITYSMSTFVTNCTNNTTSQSYGPVTSSGQACPIIPTTPTPPPDDCAAADASQFCSNQCCTTNTGVRRCGTKDCSIPIVTTPPPVVTPPPARCTDPGADNYGSVGACSYYEPTPMPDLTAGSISPTLVTPGTTVTLSATITNGGNDTTGTWFYSFIQVADAQNGGGNITDLPAESMSTLAPGRTAQVTASFTPPSEGIYSARACADKSNRSNSGRISESSEGNNCSSWTTIYVTNPPIIRDVTVNFPNITFVCDNSFSYSAKFNETGGSIGSGSTASGQTITVPISREGNYTLTCTAGPLNDSAVATYVRLNVLSDLSITANPRTVGSNKSTTISWSVYRPTNLCSLRAEVVCTNGHDSCTQSQLTEESRINTELQGTTNNNDPYGPGRNIPTAVKTPAPLNDPGNDKALGTKTVQMNNSTDFILDCGKDIMKKVRVIVSNENEG